MLEAKANKSSKKIGKNFGRKFGEVISKVDLFGKEVPQWNLRGETTVNTAFGGFVSIIVMAFTLAYAAQKFYQLYTKANPNISGATILDYTDRINLQEAEFAMAFSLESFYNPVRKEDKRYIEVFAVRWTEF